jgi:hypothetical protein
MEAWEPEELEFSLLKFVLHWLRRSVRGCRSINLEAGRVSNLFTQLRPRSSAIAVVSFSRYIVNHSRGSSIDLLSQSIEG